VCGVTPGSTGHFPFSGLGPSSGDILLKRALVVVQHLKTSDQIRELDLQYVYVVAGSRRRATQLSTLCGLWEYWDNNLALEVCGTATPRYVTSKRSVVPIPSTKSPEGILLRSILIVFWRHESFTLCK
jgi:hypothetical protein